GGNNNRQCITEKDLTTIQNLTIDRTLMSPLWIVNHSKATRHFVIDPLKTDNGNGCLNVPSGLRKLVEQQPSR
ncbi:MAG: hypothetical protein ACKO57_00245, partial [Alphaproteobacteria bacterium]